MNEHCVREMTFGEMASNYVRESEEILQTPSGDGEPSKEICLLFQAKVCIKKGISELEQIKASFESLKKEYDFYRCETDRINREHENTIKTICKLIK
jgi:hypothetical protein